MAKSSYANTAYNAARLVATGLLASGGTRKSSNSKDGNRKKRKLKGKRSLKRGRSMTKTKGRKKTVRKVLSGHNDMSSHYFNLKKLGSKLVKSMGTFRYAEQRQSVQEQNVPGRQMVNDLQGWCTRRQLNGTTISTDRRDGLSWSVDPFTLNPFVGVPNSTLYPGAAAGVVAGDKIHVASANYRLDLLNMTNIPADVEILYFVANHDGALSPGQAWQKCIDEEQLTQVTSVAASNDASFTGGVGFRQIDNVGNHPLQYANFKKHWRVIGQYKVVLQPGNQHTMKSRIHWHKNFTRQVLDTYDSDILYLKGVTVMPMMISHGGLVGIVSGLESVNPSKEVVNGPVKLGWKQELEYIFKALPVQRLKTTRVFEGLMEPAPPEVFTLKIVDDQDDVTIVEEA
nr:putative capsid protein [Cressdnaviricota sp.]UOF77809.1 putative capsid protein [Cressdnaviricota sp.]UOF78327.1 putative capsid protein [Cressdnaviricota sp.]UOF80966.1 putative capsid protein [Cressdnaviricota sp.]UOF82188.1 putative capsid protein [Cressdnaviricota sp.]